MKVIGKLDVDTITIELPTKEAIQFAFWGAHVNLELEMVMKIKDILAANEIQKGDPDA